MRYDINGIAYSAPIGGSVIRCAIMISPLVFYFCNPFEIYSKPCL